MLSWNQKTQALGPSRTLRRCRPEAWMGGQGACQPLPGQSLGILSQGPVAVKKSVASRHSFLTKARFSGTQGPRRVHSSVCFGILCLAGPGQAVPCGGTLKSTGPPGSRGAPGCPPLSPALVDIVTSATSEAGPTSSGFCSRLLVCSQLSRLSCSLPGSCPPFMGCLWVFLHCNLPIKRLLYSFCHP